MRYFLSRYNRFYSCVVHQRLLTLYSITAITISLVIAVWFFVGYSFLQAKITTIEQAIKNDSTLIESIHTTQKKCRDQDCAIHALKKKIQCRYLQNSSNDSPLTQIMQAAQHTGIVLNDCCLASHKKKKNNIQQHIDCVFGATLDQLIAFFDYLYAQKVPVKCLQLQMQGDSDLYEVRCSLRLYHVGKKKPFNFEKS